MKKTVSLVVAALMAVIFVSGQNVADGIKYITYGKDKSALEVLQKAYNANSKDPQTIYWYGQAFLAKDPEDTKGAKAVYQKALQDGVNDAWIWVGLGHVELLEGGDINAAKQKFEQAITATIETKGKNKGKANAAILDAIGRANADGGSKIGDPNYGIEKLKQAGEIDKTTADIYVNMGILYQKIGGEMGGEAVKAYTEAITRDPKNADAMWHIGKIYGSQNNKDLMEQYFGNAIAADPAYPQVYLSWFQYYQNRDINRAKEYLDKFIQYADKDCKTDFFYADYLFRAGKYQESLEKTKAMDAGDCKTYPMLPILYAFNYDRLGDSIQAKSYVEKFFAGAPLDKIEPVHYELAVKVFSKFPGNEAATANFLQKAIDNDTSKANKLVYMKQAADMFAKAKMYKEQVEWLQKYNDLKGGVLGEYEYYTITSAAINSKDYALALNYAKPYLVAFPEKPQPVVFYRKAAIGLDPDSSKGLAIEPLDFLDSILSKDLEKNKKSIFNNLYYKLQYYVNKSKELEKALDVTNKMLELYPTAGGEENTYAQNTKKIIEQGIQKSKQSPKPGSQGSNTKPGSTGGASSGSGTH